MLCPMSLLERSVVLGCCLGVSLPSCNNASNIEEVRSTTDDRPPCKDEEYNNVTMPRELEMSKFNRARNETFQCYRDPSSQENLYAGMMSQTVDDRDCSPSELAQALMAVGEVANQPISPFFRPILHWSVDPKSQGGHSVQIICRNPEKTDGVLVACQSIDIVKILHNQTDCQSALQGLVTDTPGYANPKPETSDDYGYPRRNPPSQPPPTNYFESVRAMLTEKCFEVAGIEARLDDYVAQ